MADPLDLVDFLTRLRSRWRVWVVAALAGAVAGAGVSALRPVRYVAEAHLLVEPPPDSVGVFVMMSPSYLDSVKSYATLANGKTVRARALEALSADQRAAAGGISAEAPPLARVVVIRADAGDPDAALALVRAVAEQTVRMVNTGRSGDDGEDVDRHERLALIDPGVRPAQPEDRRIPINALTAALFALVAAGVYESARLLVIEPGRDA